jgi:hypothetical protein
MAIDNPQEIETTKPITSGPEAAIATPGVETDEAQTYEGAADTIQPLAEPTEPQTTPISPEPVEAPRRRSRKPWVIVGGAVMAVGITIAALAGGGGDSDNNGANRAANTTPGAATDKTNGNTTNTTTPESLSSAPDQVQTQDNVEAIKQIYSNYFNGVMAGTLNAAYDQYVRVYAEDENGRLATALRDNAKAIAAEVSSFGKGASIKSVSVDVDPNSIVVDTDGTVHATVTRVYTVTNTEDSATYPDGEDVTTTYKQVDAATVTEKRLPDGSTARVFSDDTKVVSQETVGEPRRVQHQPY